MIFFFNLKQTENGGKMYNKLEIATKNAIYFKSLKKKENTGNLNSLEKLSGIVKLNKNRSKKKKEKLRDNERRKVAHACTTFIYISNYAFELFIEINMPLGDGRNSNCICLRSLHFLFLSIFVGHSPISI